MRDIIIAAGRAVEVPMRVIALTLSGDELAALSTAADAGVKRNTHRSGPTTRLK